MSDLLTLAEALNDAEVFTDGDWVESKDQDPQGDVRLVQLADVGDGCWIDKSERFLTSRKATELRCTFLKPGDVLVARMPDPLGRCCIFPGDAMPCVTVVDVCVIRPNPSRIDPRFLMHGINSPIARKGMSQYVKGTTRQRISRKNLAKIELSFPSLTVQRQIATILDAADALRAKRRESLQQLESLLQGTFLEMFGDPVTNPKGWRQSLLQDTGTHSKVGPFGSLLHKADYITGGVPLVNPKHIKHGTIEHGGDETVSESKAEELSEYRLKCGDVLMGRRGEMGRCTVIQPTQEQWLCGTGSVLIRPNRRTMTSLYLCSLLSCHPMRRHLEHLSEGAIMPSLSGTQIQSLLIPLPPLDLQNRFVSIVESIERQMARLKAHLAELNALFASLQSQAFSGKPCSSSFLRQHASA